jgi:tRNA-dihydrouridine synthase B
MNKHPLILKKIAVSPPLFCAPMAGVTHSAFRRLVAGFGGFGALCTEMLLGKALLNEKVGATPFTKRRPEEGLVWYQLALNGAENIPAIIERLRPVSPDAIDLNAGCPAPEMERQGTGASLFEDETRFERVLKTLRSSWDGVLTVKCRLWKNEVNWKPEFLKRLRIMEDCGVEAVFVHPRFFNEKLKRKARWESFEWICGQTGLPVVANGDIRSDRDIEQNEDAFASVRGIMIGRQAAVRPWLFRDWATGKEHPALQIDFKEIWGRYFNYVNEDFPPERAIGRLKEFSKYYSCNFFFGHQFQTMTQNSRSLLEMHEKAMGFLDAKPKTVERPMVAGV